ncbi:hypothetical protein PoB_003928100 [Plakobranchus ocellatus]|uniref:Uncharacterized protein n=1 Tax=Plakobranchus ocellatus TaxID=259542 RepID=A0AAV4ANP0_9GAST|nr:hypothetical protein PoB_003928100 [Plakobranchus ocellatus]
MSCQISYPVLRVGPLVCIFGSLAKLPFPCEEFHLLCAYSEVLPNSYPVLRVGPLVCTFGSLAKLPTPCGELDILSAHSEVLPTHLSRVESFTSCVHSRKSCQISFPVWRNGHLVCTFGSPAKLPIPC